MTYKVKAYWEDLKDGRHPYNPGDVYPREGYTPSPERIRELSSPQNKRGIQLIEEVKAPAKVALPLNNQVEEPKSPKKKGKADGNTARTAQGRSRKAK